MISIIVPVYNCEAYLEQCLHSILAQTQTDLELLLVDDGSVDASAGICDRYALLDSRVRVFRKANGGVSSARNLALQHVRGELLLFVDADDFVEACFVAEMVAALEGNDVAACGYDRVRPGEAQPFTLGVGRELSLPLLFEHTLCTQLVGGGCCNKIFRMSIINELGLRFDTRIAVGEDMLFLVQYYQQCSRAGYVGSILYHYRFNEVSATEAGFAQKRVDERTASIMLALEAMERYIDPASEWQRNCVGYRKARSGLRLFFQMVLSRTRDAGLMASVQHTMRSNLLAYLRSRHARILEKVVAIAMSVSMSLTYNMAAALSRVFASRLTNYRT